MGCTLASLGLFDDTAAALPSRWLPQARVIDVLLISPGSPAVAWCGETPFLDAAGWAGDVAGAGGCAGDGCACASRIGGAIALAADDMPASSIASGTA